jgi:uncharacterized protein YgiM (DUF1202 family)
MRKLYILMITAVLLLQGCSSGSATTGTSAAATGTPGKAQSSAATPGSSASGTTVSGTAVSGTSAESTKAPDNIVSKGTINTDAVRVRKAADTGSEIIQTLNKGTQVEILSKTDTKKTVGASSNYWYQISYADKTGWCFGDYVNINPDYTDKLKKAIAAVNSGEKTNFLQAANEMQEYAKYVTDNSIVDEAVAALRKVQDSLLQGYSSKLASLKIPSDFTEAAFRSPEKIKDAEIKKFASEVKDNGFIVHSVEGMYNIQVHPQFLLERFKQGMSAKTLDYYTLMADEVDKLALNDGALAIAWEELASRLAGWQSFIVQYAGTAEAKTAKAAYHDRYLYFYIAGVPNTPLIDAKTGTLDAKLKASYEQFILKYRNTKDADVVKRVYTIFEKNDFRKTEELTRFTSMYAPGN